MAIKNLLIKLGVVGDKKAKDKVKGVESSLSNLGMQAVKTGAAFFGARSIINGISTSIELAGIQEQAEKRLEVALGRRSQALLDQASALQKVTTFGDESIISVQASLGAFIDSEAQIKEATKATLDMAVAMGMDLQAAGDLVAKTLGSSTNALSRYGIEVKGAVGSTERLESLTKNVANLFGGQAQAEAETYAGRVEQLQNSLGDLAEGIGELVIPVFEELAPHIQKTIDFWKNYIGQTSKAKESDKKVSENMAQLNEQINKQIQRVELFTKASKDNNRIRKQAEEFGISFLEMKSRELSRIDTERQKLSELTEQKIKLEKVEENGFGIIANGLEIRKQEINLMDGIEKVTAKTVDSTKTLNKEKEKQLVMDLKSAALSGQSASQAMKSVVRAETMEAIAGLVASIFKTVSYPFNLILAAGAGGLASSVMDKALGGIKGFASGGIVQGDPSKGDSVPAMLTAGELILNQAQQENLSQNMGNITVNISAPLVDDTVVDKIIPAIERAKQLNIA